MLTFARAGLRGAFAAALLTFAFFPALAADKAYQNSDLAEAAIKLEAQINSHGPVSFESVRSAQRVVVETLCRLSRGGVVAFDDPEDMVA